jgi:hypothetical protein
MAPVSQRENSPRYAQVRDGTWRLWYDRSVPQAQWWPIIRNMIDDPAAQRRRSRHAGTVRIELPFGDGTCGAYLKVYQSAALGVRVKDGFRSSKALRSLRVSAQLANLGFGVAPVLAAGEDRRGLALRNAFLLTVELSADRLDQFANRLADEPGAARRQRKRAILDALGREVARLHESGFVHGDLLVTNILVARELPPRLYFIDHDRSRRPCQLVRVRQERRNLVQLNRINIPGITRSDRLRVLRRYAETRGWDRARWRSAARELARLTEMRRAAVRKSAAAVHARGQASR